MLEYWPLFLYSKYDMTSRRSHGLQSRRERRTAAHEDKTQAIGEIEAPVRLVESPLAGDLRTQLEDLGRGIIEFGRADREKVVHYEGQRRWEAGALLEWRVKKAAGRFTGILTMTAAA